MTTEDSSGHMSRRRFVRDAGLATVAVAGLGAHPAYAAPRRRVQKRPTVAVFGGGIAGLTAAHELAERGFSVSVYERRAWGGKARSTQVPGSAAGGRMSLPGEHAWRVFFGFYQHTADTMRRIPFGSNPNGVFDNLVGAPQSLLARSGGREDLVLPLGAPDPTPYTPTDVVNALIALVVQTHLPPEALAHFVRRVVVFLSSSDARRLGEWEKVSWAEFIRSNDFGDDYNKILGRLFTEFTQASRTEITSAGYTGKVVQSILYNEIGRYCNGPTFRVLNGPTNEAFIDPWLTTIAGHGANLRLGHELVGWQTSRGRIEAATVRTGAGTSIVQADWYVSALPVERTRSLWTTPILRLDPSLRLMDKLSTGWMTGLQYYLDRKLTFNRGHIFALDAPWAIEAISQAQFWTTDFSARYGDGRARDCLSAIIANWDNPGVIYGKPARECTPTEMADEVWEQLKQAVADTASTSTNLIDDMRLAHYIDPGVIWSNGAWQNEDPLVLPACGQYVSRPDVTTAIPNLILAGDYLKSDWEVANMETANHNGRRAANAILRRSGSDAPAAAVVEYPQPPEWEPLRAVDATRYALGQPNLFDAELTLPQLRALLKQPKSLTGILTG